MVVVVWWGRTVNPLIDSEKPFLGNLSPPPLLSSISFISRGVFIRLRSSRPWPINTAAGVMNVASPALSSFRGARAEWAPY